MQRLLLNTLQMAAPEASGGPAAGQAAARFAGVFLITACANHSCAPNMAVTRGGDNIGSGCPPCLRLTTTAPVAEGGELTISYVDGTLPRAERRRLLAHWAMECECRRCEAEARCGGGGISASGGRAGAAEPEADAAPAAGDAGGSGRARGKRPRHG